MNHIFSVVWNSSLQLWVVASELASRAGRLTTNVGSVQRVQQASISATAGDLIIGTRVAKWSATAIAVNLLLSSAGAWAACAPAPVDGGTTTCTGSDQITTVGSGPGLNNVTINVDPAAQMSTGENTAISVDGSSIINLGSNAVVQNNSSNTNSAAGLFGAGQNTIEFNGNNQLTLQAGATVSSLGTGAQNAAVAAIGASNAIINFGTIQGNASSAIWFLNRTLGIANTLDNYGIIRTQGAAAAIGVQAGTTGAVQFINHTGGTVNGNVLLGDGNDTVTLDTGSILNGNIDGAGGTNTFNLSSINGTSDTLAGNISNFQTLNKQGAGAWTLSGNLGNTGANAAMAVRVTQGQLTLSGTNTYAGGTTISSGGTLAVSADANMGAAALNIGYVTLDGGILRSTANVTTADQRRMIITSNNGTFQTDAGTTLYVPAGISGAGSLTKTGTGTLQLGSGNGYAGGTSINAGTLIVNNNLSFGAVNTPVIMNGGTTLQTSGVFLLARPISLGGTVTFNTASDLSVSGVISGNGPLVKNGTGYLALSNANTYTGGTQILAGSMQIGTNGSILGNMLNNGTLSFTGSSARTFSGVISGTGALFQQGTSRLVLSGINTYTGITFVTAGTLAVSQAANLGSATGSVSMGGGILETIDSFTLTRRVSLSGNNGAIQTNAGTTLTATGVVSGLGTYPLNKTGDGTLVLTAANTYTGPTVVSAGTLQIGNGGATGSIVGNTVNNATLVFNRSNALSYAGAISGNGTLNQIGAGTTQLTGNSATFSGTTNVTNGTLQVNGTLGSSASTLSVTSGATLSGNGVLGGDVSIADGIMAPGKLTINGNLGLTGASVLNYQLGQANASASPLNNLIDVGGDLTLAGRLNVTTAPGGTFGPGLYNLINYSGTLTNNGLTLGTMPVGSTPFLQTSYANQINLVNTGGLTLNYWDGPGPKFNNLVNGGSGVWQNALGNDSWTDSTGVVNAPYTSGAFSIFGGTAGTVTVDNGLGAITSAGMQFATSGYVLEGSPITLAAGSNTLRVGDGSGAAAGFVAMVDAALTGAGGVDKTDLGTLVLVGANSYTGGTRISGGTLSVSADINLGAAAGGMALNGGTLRGTASFATARAFDITANNGTVQTDTGATLTANGAFTGSGRLTKTGTGTLQLNADNTYGGGTTISGGALQLGNGGLSGSLIGDVVNNGTLIVDRSNTLNLAGAISGSGVLNQAGSGTTVLTGNHTYSGGTTITGGTLQLGNGGTTGGMVGNVVNNGTLAFKRSNAVNFAGVINGNGTLNQLGAGITQLTGNSGTFSGTTNVTNGTLQVEGTLGNAASTLAVNSGGTLSGSGVVGGNVAVADGILAPGKLTINGNLGLTGTSVLNYELGQANASASPLNDLIDVGGNLTLDGTLNVTTTPGGTFGSGLYHLINYNGTLVDNGLALGSMPAGSTSFVQTSYANQINLVNTGGLTLNYWDGPGPKFNNVVNGGSGVWQNALGNDSWTDSTGVVNAPYTSGAFSIFGGTAGTVTVDNSLGGITSAGMQFATSGYLLEGAPITLSDGSNTLRVGDGSGAGAGFVATIDAVLAGAGGVDKTDLGTLVLGGANSYSGGTRISGGTLSVSADNNLGAAAGGVVLNGGTLHGTASFITARAFDITASNGTVQTDTGVTLAANGAFTGSGRLTKTGTGILQLNADNTYGGNTTIAAGTLQLGTGGLTGSLIGDVVNNGTLIVDRSNTLNLAGVISGSGAVNQVGSGTTVFTGNNTYSGGTTITGGTLQLGNGASAGSITGNIVNNGTLAFNRTGTLAFGSSISGAGTLNQIGAGTTQLTGNSATFSGTTNVTNGTLQLNGTLGNAASTLSVNSGGTLSGNGVLGGNVAVTNGILAPGKLTINGNLGLTGASVLNYELGQANAYASPLNDLIDVGGNLTLDGTLNVTTTTPGGTFGPGLYHLINYNGTLVDNGLALGSMPAGSTAFVQTSYANQINLVNTGGLTLNYWDGTGPKFNNLVNGGSGVWQNALGNDSWTDSTGVVNAPYTSGAFAIFGGTAGTVTVDNSLGGITSAGMQFATNGYLLEGAPITLSAGGNTLRVGDGSGAGAGYVATVDAALIGTGGVDKTDLGTLVLGGANSYSGGTRISGGTLSVGADNNLGAAAGGVVLNGGTLHGTASFTTARAFDITANNGTMRTDTGVTLTTNGVFTGSGRLTKTGTGTLQFNADNTYGGNTTIAAGTLQLGTGGLTGSLIGDVVNNGTLIVDRSNTLNLAGAISGDGAVNLVGSGTTVLTGNNTYSGGTTITSGTLQLGNGASTGSIAGNIVDNGALIFNRTGTLALDGSISGMGTLNQNGAGTTRLTGNSGTFSGTTNVTNGTLQVEGTLGNAASTLAVNSGGTLSGNGVLGGNVAVTDGILAPGKLTINGNLGLTGASVLNYELGQANASASPLNDLIDVGGNLTLDGTLNVTTTTPGGTFGPGLYHLINYNGTLVDNGLALGSMPAGSTAFVQTSFANQINLVNTGGLTLNYWDGTGPKFNNVVNGGSGVWQNALGNDSWTDSTGVVNAPYTNGAFAIFGGTAGTVTVDNDLGDIISAGMQFATNGYLLQGAPITLSAGRNIIRVGNGSVARAGFVATIDAILAGGGGVEKTDLGTLVLGGANSYSGGTTISGGTVSVSADNNLGAAAGDVVLNGGTLQGTASFTTARAFDITANNGTLQTDTGVTLTTNGAFSGSGGLTKTGAGTLQFNADNTYGGNTTIAAGTLQLGNGGLTGSLIGDVVNNGTLIVDRSNTLNLAGTISGSGALNQVGSGTTVLTGTNTYSGGTTITGGTLQLGDGGATGSVVGDIVDDGTLIFNRTDALTFDGSISGSGTLQQAGSGTTTLSGDSSNFTGNTSVSNGLLVVSGNFGAAGSNISVASGGALDGNGTIGGNVFVADGLLTSTALEPITLTINGDLTLSSNSTMDYQFGQANMSGGVFNDLTVVGGNLTLDGLLNVIVPSGGDFGPGIYRVISYGGTLVDNGLALGTVPPNTIDYIQTGFTGQVNLVNTTGLVLNYWDGTGPEFNGVVNGGSGIWQGTAGNTLWADSTGTLNAAYTADAFAIFGGDAGTVTVDNSLGAVTSSGMQFIVDGYRVEGGPIELVGATNFIRVGDGTQEGANYVATIESELNGTGGVTLSGLGTLVLSGNNGYQGGTTIQDATLQLGDGGSSGAIIGDVINDGALAFDRSDTSSFTGAINGTGDVRQIGTGTTILTASNRYTGGTTIAAGTLQLGNGGNSGSIVGDVVNNGTLAFDRSDNIAFAGLISGTGAVTQMGSGTTTLSDNNSYQGGTTITAGTLSGSVTSFGRGAILDNGTLVINQATDAAFSNTIDGSGSLVKNGTGTLSLTGATTYTGQTDINAGGLVLGSGSDLVTLASQQVNIAENAFLAGVSRVAGAINNLGTLFVGTQPQAETPQVSAFSAIQPAASANVLTIGTDLNNSGKVFIGNKTSEGNATAGNQLVVNGNYTGNNGLLHFNTALGDDTSATDSMIVKGNSSGTTRVSVDNAGGLGAQTVEGIELIQVNGVSDGDFVQQGRIVAGVYDYSLARGTGANVANWYLTSVKNSNDDSVARPEAGSYVANLAAANSMFLTRLYDRSGETQYIDAITGESKVTSMWLRNQGGHNRFRDDSGQLATQSNRYVLQLGGEIGQWSSNSQDGFHLGAMAGYGNSKSRTRSDYQSDGSVNGYSVGLYGTWYANEKDKLGLYVDSWAQYSWFNNTVNGQGLSGEEYKSKGITASVESGYTFKLGENATKDQAYFIQPKAQMVWMGVKADRHTEANGTQVSGEGNGNLQTRLGARAYMKVHSTKDSGKNLEIQPYVEVNWLHNTKNFGVAMDGAQVTQAGAKNIGELKLGVEGQLNKKLSVWSNVGVQIGNAGYNDTAVMLGLKYNF